MIKRLNAWDVEMEASEVWDVCSSELLRLVPIQRIGLCWSPPMVRCQHDLPLGLGWLVTKWLDHFDSVPSVWLARSQEIQLESLILVLMEVAVDYYLFCCPVLFKGLFFCTDIKLGLKKFYVLWLQLDSWLGCRVIETLFKIFLFLGIDACTSFVEVVVILHYIKLTEWVQSLLIQNLTNIQCWEHRGIRSLAF